VRKFVWIALSCVIWPSTVMGGPCGEFSWDVSPDMVVPEILRHGQDAIQAGQLLEARDMFATYLKEQEEGKFAEGSRWVMASLPDPSDASGREIFQRITRLQAMKTSDPDSVYAHGPCAQRVMSIGRLDGFRKPVGSLKNSSGPILNTR